MKNKQDTRNQTRIAKERKFKIFFGALIALGSVLIILATLPLFTQIGLTWFITICSTTVAFSAVALIGAVRWMP